jgi:DNA (cytosine-5)-methyltransferase 1
VTVSRESPTMLSVFTGMGGLDLGFESAGFRNVGCIEIDDDARAAQHANRPNWVQLATHDVHAAAKDLTFADLGIRREGLQLILAAPPCQPFSMASLWARSARGLEDPRAATLDALLTLVERLCPEVVVIENVAGFVRGDNGALGHIERKLKSINRRTGSQYCASSLLLEADKYGVPQHRIRAFVVIRRDGHAFRFPEPTTSHRQVSAWDALADCPLNGDLIPQLRGRWADLVPTIPEGSNYLHHTRRGGGLPLFGYRTRFWSFLLKLAKDRPSWTLSASPGPSTGPFHWDNRPLAIREALRLQTFPDAWDVSLPMRAAVRLIGNATPPLLAQEVAAEVLRQILRVDVDRRKLPLRVRRTKRQPPPATPPMAVPEKYVSLVALHPDHPGKGRGPGAHTPRRSIDA